jgi:nucleotidyltransferase/DNA polymerase involved in DNA repair
VVTGKERGIAASMSYEAKARGVTRGMRIAEIRKVCPEAVILPSDYETYSLLSKRFFAIVRRYTPDVEEYSIDECFADLTGLRRPLRMSYLQIAER